MASILLDEIRAQPGALEALADGLAGSDSPWAALEPLFQRSQARPHIILTGMGASYFASLGLQQLLARMGLRLAALEASTLLDYPDTWFEPKAVVVGVSQSGETQEVVSLTRRLKGRYPVVAITNTEASTLAKLADAVVPLNLGIEKSVSAVKTFTGTLLALWWLGEHVLGRYNRTTWLQEVQALCRDLRTLLQGPTPFADVLGAELAGHSTHLFVSTGVSLATAAQGALMDKEIMGHPAEALSAGYLKHGPMEAVGPESVLVFTGLPEVLDEDTIQLVWDAQRFGAATYGIGRGEGWRSILGPERLSVVPSCTELSWLVKEALILQLSINQAGMALGLEPGVSRKVSKVYTGSGRHGVTPTQ